MSLSPSVEVPDMKTSFLDSIDSFSSKRPGVWTLLVALLAVFAVKPYENAWDFVAGEDTQVAQPSSNVVIKTEPKSSMSKVEKLVKESLPLRAKSLSSKSDIVDFPNPNHNFDFEDNLSIAEPDTDQGWETASRNAFTPDSFHRTKVVRGGRVRLELSQAAFEYVKPLGDAVAVRINGKPRTFSIGIHYPITTYLYDRCGIRVSSRGTKGITVEENCFNGN